MDNWEIQQQQQARAQQYRSQSMSVPASQFSGSAQQYPQDYGQHNLDRRGVSGYPSPLPPLQVPHSYSQADTHNLPSSSLQMTRGDRHRAQSTMMPSAGQRDGYASSSGYPRMAQRGATMGPGYSEATVPISRHHAQPSAGQWGGYPPTDLHPPPAIPHISSLRSGYQHPVSSLSRELAPLSEVDRRMAMPMPTVEESQQQPKPKPHVCDQCGAAFSRAHDLKRHVETHKGDRPHKCPTCTKAFSRKDALQRHQSMAQCGVDPQEYQ